MHTQHAEAYIHVGLENNTETSLVAGPFLAFQYCMFSMDQRAATLKAGKWAWDKATLKLHCVCLPSKHPWAPNYFICVGTLNIPRIKIVCIDRSKYGTVTTIESRCIAINL